MVPTDAQFAQALKSLEESGRLSNTDKRMLKLHYESPERKLTPRRMSELMGWGGKTANRRYGDLARRVTEQLNWTPIPQTALRSYYVEGLVLGSREESEFVWTLRREVARALEHLHWVDPHVTQDDITQNTQHEQQYWALVADPRRYRIRDAVANRSVDTWTSRGKSIQAGDCVVIWQSRDNAGRRGIVALGRVISGPQPCADADNPYWINPEDGAPIAERIEVQYIEIVEPLWVGGAHDDILAPLSVAKARGGTVFHVTADQWKSIDAFATDRSKAKQAEVAFDIEQLKRRKELGPTQRDALIKARLGQGQFRRDLLKYWASCAVVGCTVEAALRASHIKPWSKSSDVERLDPANGLLLVATLDALFNDGLISFDDNGQMIVSNRLTAKDRSLLQLRGSLRKKPSQLQQKYLRFHRKKEFRA
jgi:EVE domain/HNH endonuclease